MCHAWSLGTQKAARPRTPTPASCPVSAKAIGVRTVQSVRGQHTLYAENQAVNILDFLPTAGLDHPAWCFLPRRPLYLRGSKEVLTKARMPLSVSPEF